MAYDLEEQEKLDAIKAWWERYGTLCLMVVTLAVAALAGVRGWQWYQDKQATQALAYFEALEAAVTEAAAVQAPAAAVSGAAETGAGADAQTSDTTELDEALGRIKAASATLRNEFPDSGYTVRGVLLAAQTLQDKGDLDAAQEQLTWLTDNAKDPAFLSLARLRLATLLLARQEFDAALAQLQNPPAAFAALFDDRRGDVLAAQGKLDEAHQAWESALAAAQGEPLQQVIRLKLDAIVGA